MIVRRGDVLLVDFPFSGGTGGKVRPALVVQNDLNNRRLTTTIVAMITTTTHLAGIAKTQFLIDVTSADGSQSGLLHNSAVKCENLFTLDNRRILRLLGNLPAPLMTKADECLRASLHLL